MKLDDLRNRYALSQLPESERESKWATEERLRMLLGDSVPTASFKDGLRHILRPHLLGSVCDIPVPYHYGSRADVLLCRFTGECQSCLDKYLEERVSAAYAKKFRSH